MAGKRALTLEPPEYTAKETFRLRTQSASDACADYLRERIISGDLADGESIVIDRVAADIGVSHTPVREAIRRLEAEGLVTYRANHGARVRSLDREEFEELVMLRKSIEPAIITVAIDKAGPGAFAGADVNLEEWKHAIGAREMLSWQWMFLRALYAPSGLQRSMELTDANWMLTERYHRHSWQTSSDIRAEDLAHKRAVLDACCDRDAVTARDALIAAIEWGASIVRRQLDDPSIEPRKS